MRPPALRLVDRAAWRAQRGPLVRLAAAAGSGLLLATAFPPLARSDGAWFALVPLLLALRRAPPREGFRLGWMAGFCFGMPSLAWLWRLIENGGPTALVLLGHGLLAAYCALFAGLFGAGVAGAWQRGDWRASPLRRLAAVLLLEPLAWAGSEYLRGVVLTGFGWNGLGVSQSANTALIQVAALGGVPAVSALVLAINAGIAAMLERVWEDVLARHVPGAARRSRWRLRSGELLVALAVLMLCWSWGMRRERAWRQREPTQPRWRLALVHPNAPSIFERSERGLQEVCETLLNYTELAAATSPDLCIWPETTLPGSVPFESASMAMASNATARAGAPLLTGALEIEPGPGWEWQDGAAFYNAACLFGADGRLLASYRKQHLVPFGEFVPLDRFIPLLKRLSPIGYSCTAGTNSTILRIPRRAAAEGREPATTPLRLSPLICFEDTLPYLSRRAVRAGAQLLVNLTNDAWFDGSCEPEQHLAQAIFRCVESGVPMVRAANSGVTCTINPVGGVVRRLQDSRGTRAAGFLFDNPAVPDDPLPTLYNRLGDWAFGLPAAFLLLALAMRAILR